MNRVEQRQREWSEEQDRQPGGQGRREVVAFAEILASELSGEKESAEHQAHTGADEHVAVLIAKDNRDAHENEDNAQERSSQTHMKEDGHGSQSSGIGFAQLMLEPGCGRELKPIL